jgi:hypothetical protein
MKFPSSKQPELKFDDERGSNPNESSGPKTSNSEKKPDPLDEFNESSHSNDTRFNKGYDIPPLKREKAYLTPDSDLNELIKMADGIEPEDNLGHRLKGLFPGILISSIIFLIPLHDANDWIFIFGLLLFAASCVGTFFYFTEDIQRNKRGRITKEMFRQKLERIKNKYE